MMFKRLLVATATGMMALAGVAQSVQAAASWDAFVIRDSGGNIPPNLGNGGATVPTITEKISGAGVTTLISLGGQKTGYGTSDFDGQALSSIKSLDYTRIDGGSKHPYINIWVSDGVNFAILAPSVSTVNTNVKGLLWASLNAAVFETDFTSLGWLFPGAQRIGQYLYKSDGVTLVTLAELGSLTIDSPTFPHAFVGTGAPRNGNGINLIFGDTANNFLNGGVPYEIDNLSITPVPSPVAAHVGLAMMGLLALFRRPVRNGEASTVL